jgi:hypothetical protein
MYVVGYPKSGNTWLCFLLAYCLNSEYDDFDAPGIHPRNEYQRQYVKGGLPHTSYQNLVGSVLKTHQLHLKKRDNYPLIYLVRDGRDVMVSYYFYRHTYVNIYQNKQEQGNIWQKINYNWGLKKLTADKTSSNLSLFIRKYTSDWIRHVTTWLEKNPNAILRYEDIKAAPEETLDKLMTSFGIKVSPEIICQGIEIFEFQKLAQRKAGEENPQSFFRKGITGDWKNHFSESDIKFFEEKAGELLIKLGYNV